MRVAICPGSYDPVTYGHINIIERSARMFDRVIAVVMVNITKKTVFTLDCRMKMLRRATAHISNVEVDGYDGLVTEYADIRNADVMVRGLRAVTDFEYEFQMAMINKKLNPKLETVFINSDVHLIYLSSSVVREVACFGGHLSEFVPPAVEKRLREHFREQKSSGLNFRIKMNGGNEKGVHGKSQFA